MKSRKSIAKFLALLLLSMGFFVLVDQDVNAQQSCEMDYEVNNGYCSEQCAGITNFDAWQQCTQRCYASADATLDACYASSAWQDWLLSVDLNIGDTFRILNEPDPSCAYYPDALFNCGALPTAGEIEACVMIIHQEQAKFHCP
jgi:hypothetical protein